jgi:hypothetical protein
VSKPRRVASRFLILKSRIEPLGVGHPLDPVGHGEPAPSHIIKDADPPRLDEATLTRSPKISRTGIATFP